MILAALALAWFFGLDLWAYVAWDATLLWTSAAALVPLLVLFQLCYVSEFRPLREIRTLLLDLLGPPLAACRWYDLPLLAALAGIGEELLFRGVLQIGVANATTGAIGLIVAAIVFGLAHAVTPTYALIAGLMGLYLGGLLSVGRTPNLVLPILVHAAYDLIAFVILRRDYRRRHARP